MFKVLFSFRIFFILLLFFPSLTLAWNSMCHSPVQLAALMSKPKSNKSGIKGMKGEISRLEKGIDKISEDLDEASELLEESLDSSKLGRAKPADVANQIKNYMESSRDSWDCVPPLSSYHLKVPFFNKELFSFFQSPELIEILAHLFLPSAHGKTEVGTLGDNKTKEDLEEVDLDLDDLFSPVSPKGTGSVPNKGTGSVPNKGTGSVPNKGTGSVPNKAPNPPKPNETNPPTENDGTGASNPSVETGKVGLPVGDDNSTKPQPPGRIFTGDISEICQKAEHQDKPRCLEWKCTKQNGGVWTDNQCCPRNQPKLLNGQCVSRSDFNKSNRCTLSRGKWENGQCVCPAERPEFLRGSCMSKKDRCTGSGKTWHATENKCCPKEKPKLLDGQCVSRSDSNRSNRCNNSGGTWQNSTKKCECPADKPVLLRGRCMSKKAKCTGPDKAWNEAKKKCCEGATPVLSEGKCISKPDSAKSKCTGPDKAWNEAKKKCCEGATPVLSEGKCISKPDSAKSKCTGPDKAWNEAKKKCCEGATPVLSGGKCISKTNSAQSNCTGSGKAWNTRGNKCCKGATPVPSGRGCISIGASKCKASGGTWRNTKCVCPSSKPKNLNGQCLSSAEFHKSKCGSGKVWKARAKKCCPTGQSYIFHNSCVSKENFDKFRECARKDGHRMVGNQCKKTCAKWKSDKAFRKNGRVDPSFCNRYASNSSGCRKALNKMKKLIRKISTLEERQDRLEDEIFEKSSADNSEKETEVGGLCFDCLKKVMLSNQPSTGQTVGNVLNLLTGTGLGLVGYNLGKRAQTDLNMLRIQQGYEAQQDYYSLMGASAGYPYIAQGLHGLTRTNTPVGGWACSPTVSPYGHSHNYQYGQGFNMMHY